MKTKERRGINSYGYLTAKGARENATSNQLNSEYDHDPNEIFKILNFIEKVSLMGHNSVTWEYITLGTQFTLRTLGYGIIELPDDDSSFIITW